MGNENISEIIRHCVKWHTLGIETKICKVEKVMGIRKFHKNSIKFSQEIGADLEKIPHDYNFLGVSLKDSGLMCLDIEATPGSLEDFNEILREKSLKMENFFAECTMNGGFHLYFRVPKGINYRNIYNKRCKRVNFDVLFNGKSFSAPSKYDDRTYCFINKTVFDLNSIMDIPEFPNDLYFLLQIEDK